MSKRRWNENYVKFGFPKSLKKIGQRKHNAFFAMQVLTNSSLKLFKLKSYFATHGGSAVYVTEAPKEMQIRCDILQKKGQNLYYCRDCVTRGPIHRQTRVTFDDFPEVSFLDFLRTGSNVD